MLEALGAVLASAVAIAISPLAIIAVILMLMTPRAAALSLGFLGGWIAGILVATSVFALLASATPEPGGGTDSQPVAGTVQVLLGLALLVLGWKKWRSRPAAGEEQALPGWMGRIETMRPLGAAALAFLLAAVKPKNLILAAAAGLELGRSGLGPGAMALVVAIFTLLAGASVIVPVLAARIAPRWAESALAGIRAALTQYYAVIMAVMMVIMGVVLLGKGLARF